MQQLTDSLASGGISLIDMEIDPTAQTVGKFEQRPQVPTGFSTVVRRGNHTPEQSAGRRQTKKRLAPR